MNPYTSPVIRDHDTGIEVPIHRASDFHFRHLLFDRFAVFRGPYDCEYRFAIVDAFRAGLLTAGDLETRYRDCRPDEAADGTKADDSDSE